MKVIFLDVDGVLNSAGLLYHYGFDYLDEDMVSLFCRVVKETGAEVVLSSSWRLNGRSRSIVSEALAVHDVEIVGTTPRLRGEPRYREISEWLSDHPDVERYAILDDDPEAGGGMGGSFFMTDLEIGLDEATARKVVRHLGPAKAS